LHIYALALQQEGIEIHSARVEFIRRIGNPYRGQTLSIGLEDPIKLEVDLSEERLNSVYEGVLATTKEMSDFYVKVSEDLLK